eukprot:TRINITY_DN6463_c0_g1_i1.p1 TRINITY_DN6463_c0_g1~~TRINITY_DN6463_c0_g1_i1.p1  ORF type:complete len:183 (-),score=19.52 TRINITY_DN6463_c0_g1_i1:439-987(-)
MVKVAGANDYLFAIVLGFCIAGIVVADIQQDTKECTQPLRKAIPCFDFVQGKEKAPSSDCCKSLETVRNSAPKCLCILMKDSTSPSLGFSLNQTRALELPQLCKVDANISLCPALLNLPANSPDARVFQALANSNSSSSGSGTSSAKDSSGCRVQPLRFLNFSLSGLVALIVLSLIGVFTWL